MIIAWKVIRDWQLPVVEQAVVDYTNTRSSVADTRTTQMRNAGKKNANVSSGATWECIQTLMEIYYQSNQRKS